MTCCTVKVGHILDLVIARTYSWVVDAVVADLISNHCAVHYLAVMREPLFVRELNAYRKMEATNFTSLSSDIGISDLYTNRNDH